VPVPFARTVRSLDSDRSIGTAALAAGAVVVLGAWVLWMLLARVPVYAVSERARLAVAGEAHPLQPAVGGRVVRSTLVIGAAVHAGETLVELDAETEKERLAEQQGIAGSMRQQLDALRQQIAAQENLAAQQGGAASADLDEARARLREAEESVRLAAKETARLARLQPGQEISQAEIDRARSDEVRKKAAAEALHNRVRRLEMDPGLVQIQGVTRLQELRREEARLQGAVEAAQNSVAALQHAVELRVVRAPVDGRIGRAVPLEPGAVVTAGQILGAVVPSGELRVVAQFTPPAALGRVRPGQSARLRLDGFPWTQYGSIRAQVAAVASEPQDERVRVELLVQGGDPRIPLEHGLPGVVEVETERLSPAAMVLRAAGAALRPEPQPPSVARQDAP
jgi:membrane fusion protein (multidrug efflux system)